MPQPTLMLCAGQRLGAPAADGAAAAAVAAELGRSIAAELALHDAGIGYCSAAAGADIVFCEELLARAGELHVFLPCPPGDFVAGYVAPAGGNWVARFEAVCSAAARVEISCEDRLVGDETLLRFNNQMLQGMARIHAERVGARARLLAVWSPDAPVAPGSPADFIDQWPEMESLSLIDIDDIRSQSAGAAGDGWQDAAADDDGLGVDPSPLVVRAVFFADMATYTAVRDAEVPLLWDFLAEVQQQVEAKAKAPILINSWGDAIHAAAETASDLADYATALVASTAATDFSAFGLRQRPKFRVALHAGPVYVGLHPLTGRSMIFGHHVNRAARIEAIAAPGEISASQHFVALLRAEMDARQHEARLLGAAYRVPYELLYVGTMDLPKNFGREAIYRIVPTGAVAG